MQARPNEITDMRVRSHCAGRYANHKSSTRVRPKDEFCNEFYFFFISN